MPASVKELYYLYVARNTPRRIEEIEPVILNTISNFTEVSVVVDGLDEGSEEDRREFQELTGLNIMVTSRHAVDFEEYFDEYTQLEVRANGGDFKIVLDSQIEQKFVSALQQTLNCGIE